jgi:hypothetical protein
MTIQKTTDQERHLALLLRRRLALEKDFLMGVARARIEEHFNAIVEENFLRDAQLKNLEGVAFSALNRGEVIKFINKQADKDRDQRPERQKWVVNNLDKQLLAEIAQIAGREAGKTSGEIGRKDAVAASVKEKATASGVIVEGAVNAWFDAEREQEIQMELLREFISHFAVFYTLKANERRKTTGVTGEKEQNA